MIKVRNENKKKERLDTRECVKRGERERSKEG